jgi:hypothetical protein
MNKEHQEAEMRADFRAIIASHKNTDGGINGDGWKKIKAAIRKYNKAVAKLERSAHPAKRRSAYRVRQKRFVLPPLEPQLDTGRSPTTSGGQ